MKQTNTRKGKIKINDENGRKETGEQARTNKNKAKGKWNYRRTRKGHRNKRITKGETDKQVKRKHRT